MIIQLTNFTRIDFPQALRAIFFKFTRAQNMSIHILSHFILNLLLQLQISISLSSYVNVIGISILKKKVLFLGFSKTFFLIALLTFSPSGFRRIPSIAFIPTKIISYIPFFSQIANLSCYLQLIEQSNIFRQNSYKLLTYVFFTFLTSSRLSLLEQTFCPPLLVWRWRWP